MPDLFPDAPRAPAIRRCSERLHRHLVETENQQGSLRAMREPGELRAEIRMLGREVIAQGKNAKPVEIVELVMRHAGLYGLDGQPPSLFAPYGAGLCDLPLAALEEAFARWQRHEGYPRDPGRHEVMPKPDELARLAKDLAIPLRKAAWRARQTLEFLGDALEERAKVSAPAEIEVI